MYTILENARIVIALLKKHNIRHIVISPGGSNIPIVQGVQQDPFFKCYSVVDERSAMYFAIGIYLQTGELVATSCTSAQATRNYLPGLTEAFYKRVPILAITMSKHPRYLGQDYMQCPIQTSLPVDSVKKSYNLPCINSEHDRALCVRTANEAMLELTHHGMGPVQLNIEELDNETWVFDENIESLPDVRCIKRYSYWEDINNEDLKGKRIMVVIGEHRPFTTRQQEALDKFSLTHNVFVYTNHTSNYHGKFAINAHPVVFPMTQNAFMEKYKPDIVITIGGLTGDYGIFFKLSAAPEHSMEHWRINVDGTVVDTYAKLTRIYEMRFEDFFEKMTSTSESNHEYFHVWKTKSDTLDYSAPIPLSNLYAAINLCKRIPANSYMNYAILNSLRVWNFVQIDPSIKAFSNLAAFGIDGCMSTAFGESVGINELSFLIIGDLAFYYDMNALGIRHIKNNVRILLCNNNGGMEFKLGNLQEKTVVGSYISADNHFKNSKGWAETNGFYYISVTTTEEFDAAVNEFVSPSEKPIIIEIFITPDDERTANSTFVEKNWFGTQSEIRVHSLKGEVKGALNALLGEAGMRIVRKVIGK